MLLPQSTQRRTPALPGDNKEQMKALPETPELLAVAARVVWFKPPREALAEPIHFLAHVMTYGTLEDVRVLNNTSVPPSIGKRWRTRRPA